MPKHRVLLVCSQYLFGESMETILRAEADVELIGPWELDEGVCAKIGEACPSVVLIVSEDSQSESSAELTSTIMESFPDLPIIRAALTENLVRVHWTHILPARGADLLETIRSLPETKISSKKRGVKKDDQR